MMRARARRRFVGYLEEEAVKTYTHCIEELDAGKLPKWTSMPAPAIAREYWKLGGTRAAAASISAELAWLTELL